MCEPGLGMYLILPGLPGLALIRSSLAPTKFEPVVSKHEKNTPNSRRAQGQS